MSGLIYLTTKFMDGHRHRPAETILGIKEHSTMIQGVNIL